MEADLAESSWERWSLLAPISVLGITEPEHFKLSIHHDIIDINTWPFSEKYIWSDLSRNPLSLRSCHNSGSGDLGHQACHLLGRGHLPTNILRVDFDIITLGSCSASIFYTSLNALLVGLMRFLKIFSDSLWGWVWCVPPQGSRWCVCEVAGRFPLSSSQPPASRRWHRLTSVQLPLFYWHSVASER